MGRGSILLYLLAVNDCIYKEQSDFRNCGDLGKYEES